MNPEKMRESGQITRQQKFTDEDLDLAIDGTRCALAYLEGKGLDWSLAANPLRIELLQLERFKEMRKRG